MKADDLLDRLIDKAARRGGAAQPRHRRRRGSGARREQIAVAALRYFMVKFSRAKIIAFDIDEALSFEGESGPYLQYAAVRAATSSASSSERDGLDEADVVARLARRRRTRLAEGEEGDDLWGLVLEAARLDEVVEQAVRALEPSLLAKYAFGLAQAFNAFYHRYPILNEEREDARLWRAAVAAYVRRQMTAALDLMGAAVPAEDVGRPGSVVPVSPARHGDGPAAGLTIARRVEQRRLPDHPMAVAAPTTPGDVPERCARRRIGARRAPTGGADVDPALYGERPTPALYGEAAPLTGRGRASRSSWCSRAIERDVPVLAICRGVQVLNVAAGGTLVQDIPRDVPQPLEHNVADPASAIAHDV